MGAKRLIVNADDFGYGRRISDAIIDCHVNGIITSTSLMTNMPAAEYACQRAKEAPSLGVGVHLTLTVGRPLLPADSVPDLVDQDGRFLGPDEQKRRLWCGRRVAKQVVSEYEAQVQRALDLGISPTHCDSHHGVHKMPLARNALLEAAKRFGIRWGRFQTPGYWSSPDASLGERLVRVYRNARLAPRTVFHCWNRRVAVRSGLRLPDRIVWPSRMIPRRAEPREEFIACLAALGPALSATIMHPGYEDPDVKDSEDFAAVRRSDTEVARDPSIMAAVKQHDIELTSFREL